MRKDEPEGENHSSWPGALPCRRTGSMENILSGSTRCNPGEGVLALAGDLKEDRRTRRRRRPTSHPYRTSVVGQDRAYVRTRRTPGLASADYHATRWPGQPGNRCSDLDSRPYEGRKRPLAI